MNHSIDKFVARILKNHLKTKDYIIVDAGKRLKINVDQGAVNQELLDRIPYIFGPSMKFGIKGRPNTECSIYKLGINNAVVINFYSV